MNNLMLSLLAVLTYVRECVGRRRVFTPTTANRILVSGIENTGSWPGFPVVWWKREFATKSDCF